MESMFVEGRSFGDPSVLRVEKEELRQPQAGEVLLRHDAIGVNFIDVLQRRGELAQTTPYRLGLEAAGEVLAVGPDVSDIAVGDRIVYAGGPAAAYSSARLLPAGRAVKLPATINAATAASVFFKALTADYLVNRLRPLAAGDAVLFTAAAGGVGSLAVPLLKAAGVLVIGTVGSPDKVDYARQLGCDQVLVLPRDAEDLVGKVREWTGGRGVAIAYDSIGKATFDLSLASVSRFGLLVSYGWASGEVAPVQLARLREQGSVFLTRPTVSHYTETRTDLLDGAARVFSALERGVIRSTLFKRLPLDRAGDAHALLEAGTNTGSIILDPT
ncbi:quinone oxidoreductase family protein [Azospirillum doebereinerae]